MRACVRRVRACVCLCLLVISRVYVASDRNRRRHVVVKRIKENTVDTVLNSNGYFPSFFKSSAACEDLHNTVECKGWASNGECRLNPAFMIPNCRKSCKKCQGEDTDSAKRKSIQKAKYSFSSTVR